MVYPWSKKPKDEETSKDEKTLDKEKTSEDEKTLDKEETSEEEKTLDKEETSEDGQRLDDAEESNDEEVSEDEETPSDIETSEDPNNLILNILKLEDYKMNSGELFQAFREAGGEMQDFKNELDRLSETGKIKSDSDGNIMTVQNFNHEKSQLEEEHTSESEEENIEEKDSEEDDKANDTEDEAGEDTTEEVTDKNDSEQSSAEGDEDIESIIKLKEETDNWLIEQLKNKGNSNGNDSLKAEVAELKDRVNKLENVIKNITKAFE